MKADVHMDDVPADEIAMLRAPGRQVSAEVYQLLQAVTRLAPDRALKITGTWPQSFPVLFRLAVKRRLPGYTVKQANGVLFVMPRERVNGAD